MSKCNVCGVETDVIVNIDFKEIPVCDPCCLAITKQTVASLKVEILKPNKDAELAKGVRRREDGWG